MPNSTPEVKFCYTLHFTIASVRERTRVARAGKADPSDPKSEIVVERESLGYFLELSPGLLTLRLGAEAAPLGWVAGKRVKLKLMLED